MSFRKSLNKYPCLKINLFLSNFLIYINLKKNNLFEIKKINILNI